MQKLNLEVTKRDLFGKKLKKMRKEGLIPGNIFGPQFKSQSVSFATKDFNKIFKVAKETGIVYLRLGKDELPVLIKNVQKHPVSGYVLHVDLRKIDLKQKIETQVPIEAVGESPAVIQKGGVLLTHMNEVLVEALPENIPHEIKIDVSSLLEVGQEIKIAGLPKSATFQIKEDPEKVIVSVIAHKEESLEPETAAIEPEVITEKPVEGEETQAGEVAVEETPKPEAKTPQAKAPESKEPASAKPPGNRTPEEK